ncbi:MAG TPA: periplasmic heavy metal sensor [Candidatus Binatia bacterium]|jgi:Spy/CpxP family protein refolding chaperone
MRTIVAIAFAIILAAPVFAASDRPNRPFEDGSSVWDQLGREFEDFGNKLREHFGGNFPFGPRGGESRGERPVISYMLSHREELKLTPEQVKKLEGLRSDFERDARKNQDDLRAAEKSLDDLTRSDSVDLKQAEAKVREVERLRADQRIARIRAVEQGKSVLSQEQRDRLRDMMNGNRYTRRPEDRDRRSDSDRGQRKQRGDQSPQGESF